MNRRQVVAAIFLGLGGGQRVFSSVLATSMPNAREQFGVQVPNDYLAECVEVASVWAESQESTPEAFVMRKLEGVHNCRDSICHVIAADYEQGDILDVNGLILSKTEAALLALLVSGGR